MTMVERMILCGRANQCGAANIDILDASPEIVSGTHRLLEGVQVDRDQIDLTDIVLRHFRLIIIVVAPRKYATVDFWM